MRLPLDDAQARFAQGRVGRLATVGEHAAPHLVPITFAMLDEHTVVFAVDDKPKSTFDLQRLRNISANPVVSLLVDQYGDDWSQLWWVRADGYAGQLVDSDGRAAALQALAAKYPQYVERPPAGPAVRIRVQSWAGWSAAG